MWQVILFVALIFIKSNTDNCKWVIFDHLVTIFHSRRMVLEWESKGNACHILNLYGVFLRKKNIQIDMFDEHNTGEISHYTR